MYIATTCDNVVNTLRRAADLAWKNIRRGNEMTINGLLKLAADDSTPHIYHSTINDCQRALFGDNLYHKDSVGRQVHKGYSAVNDETPWFLVHSADMVDIDVLSNMAYEN